MKAVYRGLKSFCVDNEWAANLFAFVGVGQFLATIWITIEYQLLILDWIRENILLHLAALGAASFVNVFLMASFLFLGFAECRADEENCIHAYRGRRSGNPFLPGVLNWMDSLGKKSRRGPAQRP